MIGKATSGSAASSIGCKKAHRTPFRTRPPDQKTNQDLFKVFVDRHAVVIDGRFEHDLLQVASR